MLLIPRPIEKGYVACYRGVDLPALRAALAVPIEEMKTPHAGIFPEFEHLELFASQVPGLPFATLLKMMAEESRLDGKFFFCRQDPLVEVAKLIESVRAPLPPPLNTHNTLWLTSHIKTNTYTSCESIESLS